MRSFDAARVKTDVVAAFFGEDPRDLVGGDDRRDSFERGGVGVEPWWEAVRALEADLGRQVAGECVESASLIALMYAEMCLA